MREIKFRAWNGEEMTRNFSLLDLNYEWFPSWLHEHEDTDSLKDWVVLMQYTWLKDKNWKEIYEGDMLKYKRKNIEYSRVHYISDWFKIVTVLSPTRNKISMLAHFLTEYQCEVAWNVYQDNFISI